MDKNRRRQIALAILAGIVIAGIIIETQKKGEETDLDKMSLDQLNNLKEELLTRKERQEVIDFLNEIIESRKKQINETKLLR